MKIYHVIIASVMVLAACSRANVSISGQFCGCSDKDVYLEKILPGNAEIVDSTTTDSKGNFNFKLNLPPGEPTIFNLRYQDQVIPLLLEAGEKVKLVSMGAVAYNYSITGSEGSSQIRDLKNLLTHGSESLDSILTVYASTPQHERKDISKLYNSKYYKIKREHIRFIVSNPRSIAALYALYQRLPGDTYLSSSESDLMYYKMVADSVAAEHPNSPYLKALQADISQAETQRDLTNLINEKLGSSPDTYPEIELPDIYGEKHRLSALMGKVIILDFWSYTSAQCKAINAEYKRLLEQFPDLAIYQVSVDEDRSQWVTSVTEQKLPWITVGDSQGASSVAVLAYNVRKVPSNYIIDREGNIVEKDLYGDKLTDRISQLLLNS